MSFACFSFGKLITFNCGVAISKIVERKHFSNLKKTDIIYYILYCVYIIYYIVNLAKVCPYLNEKSFESTTTVHLFDVVKYMSQK